MALEAVEVTARWKSGGGFEPQHFFRKSQIYRVESVGRGWEDETGCHVLCMAGGQVYELIFSLNPAGWHLRLPSNAMVV